MEIQSFTELFKALKENYNSIYSYGIIDRATGHFVYNIYNNLKRPVFVLLENEKKAFDLYQELVNMEVDVLYFPDLEENYQLIENLDYTNKTHRMKTIISLFNEEKKVIISTFSAISRKIINKDLLKELVLDINIDKEINLEELSKKLTMLGYEKRNIIEAKGEFAIRGDIIDIFQIFEENPTRLELFDIEVDSIRKFNINTQMSIENIDSFTIYPNMENFVNFLNSEEIVNKIKEDLKFSRKIIKDKEKLERLEKKFNRLIEDLEYNEKIDNIDLIIPYLKDNHSLIEYFSKDTIVVFDDISIIEEVYKNKEIYRNEEISDKIENGELLKTHKYIYYDFETLYNLISKYQKINISIILKNLRIYKADKLIEFFIRENESFYGKFDNFVESLKHKIEQNYKNYIFAQEENVENLKKELKIKYINAVISDSLNSSIENNVVIVKKYLSKGFEYYKDKVNFISYSQIFNKIKKKKSKTIKNKDIINYSDLVPGDLLVHDSYGIGEYIGIKNIELDNKKSDFIELHYSGGDKLYVPTSDMSMISKFIGKGDNTPKLSNLNTSEWKKSKTKAKKQIEKIAEDLVELYAKRLNIEGFKFSKDSPWQHQFEDNFIYQETDAQLRAVDEIKEDMESNKVMDRLLCGDVGYGKTEVALRAAFKAIMDGKQVIMLAPTTILVKQHFETIKNRFSDFPINVDYLSRFKTNSQKNKTLESLKKGALDFVVGTHALLSNNVEFDNLGLLIIDEEQRFGVRHKDKIKKMSENIDVLTLSATPIPRTLQMSLSGIRDMSLLDEHPQNRLPINTYVMEFDSIYIREAILREMSRNGQIYFVYNKVKNINYMYKKLVELVPEARIAISHGQMSTRELENVLDDFTNYEYDILLTTTIIETGMDIQNVNTLIVYNADAMGLSQLYQLKGRVGRSNRSSYAYFTYSENKIITEIAEKRLKAIKDFNELGSGYKIAMRDLELRGAGNLLGESQSGHIESIGYDLYVRMLKETIDEIKGIKTKKIDKNVKIDLNLDIYIPDEYIKDENEKINIYKKISYIENEDDHYNIIDELTDRFGDIPKPVQNIIDISYIRALLIQADFDAIIEKENYIAIYYEDIEIFNFENLKILSEKSKVFEKFNYIDTPTIYISNKGSYLYNLIEILKEINNIKEGKYNEK